MQAIDPKVGNGGAPEWAHRFLTINEFCGITGESRSSYYRKAGTVYPRPVRMGGSSRVPGWEAWQAFQRLVANSAEAA